MGRKRKTETQEVKAVNGSTDATFSKDKTDNSNDVGAAKSVEDVKKSPNSIPLKKHSKVTELALRRSVRINSPGLVSQSLKARPIVEHISLIESIENEQEEVNMEDSEREADIPEMNDESLEEKVDYLIRMTDDLKSKFGRRAYPITDEGSPENSYKRRYFKSQKRVEALVEENYNLVRKLEFANGKIEAYESMNALIAQREVILVSSLAKATEQLPAASPPPPPPPLSPPAATIAAAPKSPKRKKDNRKKQVTFRENSS